MTKLFDMGLYRVGLRRVKVAGLFSAIVTVVGSAVFPIIQMIRPKYSDILDYTDSFSISSEVYAPFLWGLILLAPCIMASMFSFLTNRRDSDFYHSLPYRRTTLYVSFLAAAMTWIWGILLVTITVCGGLWLAVGPSVTLSWATVGKTILLFGVATLTTAALIPAALSATGTGVSAAALYVTVMLVPKFTVWMFVKCLTERATALYIPEKTLGYLSFGLFEPFAMIRGFDVVPIVYSTVLSLIFVVLGGVLFRLRRSEVAGVPAPNRLLQVIYRTAFTLPLLLVIVYLVFINATSTSVSLIVVLSVTALVIYYLYELLTTKKIRSMLAATKFVWLLPAIVLLFWGGVMLTSNGVINATPQSADEIDHVRIACDCSDKNAVLYFHIAETPIYDEEIKSLVIKSYVKSGASWTDSYYSSGISTVEITTTDGQRIMRKIHTTDILLDRIQSYCASKSDTMRLEPEYCSYVGSLRYPSEDGYTIIAPYPTRNFPQMRGPVDALLSTFIEEYNALPPDERRELNSSKIYGTICIRFAPRQSWPYPLKDQDVYFNISEELTPRSYRCLLEFRASMDNLRGVG